MDLTSWAAVAEIIAAAAVILSLWYIAIQVRQSAELTRVSLEVELGMNWALMHDNMIQDPDLSEAYILLPRIGINLLTLKCAAICGSWRRGFTSWSACTFRCNEGY